MRSNIQSELKKKFTYSLQFDYKELGRKIPDFPSHLKYLIKFEENKAL